MSKECPSCHREVGVILQCRNEHCRMEYCVYCTDSIALLMPWLLLDQEAMVTCPKCGEHGDIISSVDDDNREENNSSSQEGVSDETSYSSSDYSGSSGTGCGEGIFALVIIGILFVLASSKQGGYEEWTHVQTQTYNQNSVVANNRPQYPGSDKVPTNTPPKENTYFFQNTLPGTYNMGGNRNQTQQKNSGTEVTAKVDSDSSLCDECSRFPYWEMIMICRHKELAALHWQVVHLKSIYDMAEDSFSHPDEESSISQQWLLKVEKDCKEDKSPVDCLRCALEARSKHLQEVIPRAIASPVRRNYPFDEIAKKRWENHDW